MTDRRISGTGCLLVHGYGGSTFEMEGIAAALERAGFASRMVALPGHGEGYANFGDYGFPHWLAHAEKEYRAMAEHYERVLLVGFSMGGTISLNLASRYPVAGIVTLSAPVFTLGLWPWPMANLKLYGRIAVLEFRRLLGLHKHHHGGETSRDIAPWKGYRGPVHFRQLAGMHKGCKTLRALLPGVIAPILIIQDARDGLVYPDNAWAIARRVSSPDTRVILTRIRESVTSHHMLTTHRETASLVEEEVVRFCKEKTLDRRP
ncbi:MAG: alpha/beta fold hydrolase [Deltaproteobacteria bacterium]|nr:alpha/beta fold hydrolase [Deltaproteobacteria bacterium]